MKNGKITEFDGVYYYLNNLLHKEDEPAIEYFDGAEAWYLNGKKHRINGPAYIGIEDYWCWYQYGKRHRSDGPAIILGDKNYWYFEDKRIQCNSQKEFEKLIKLRAFW